MDLSYFRMKSWVLRNEESYFPSSRVTFSDRLYCITTSNVVSRSHSSFSCCSHLILRSNFPSEFSFPFQWLLPPLLYSSLVLLFPPIPRLANLLFLMFIYFSSFLILEVTASKNTPLSFCFFNHIDILCFPL